MIKLIQKYQKAYYDGNPLISNEEYDALIRKYPNSEVDIGYAGEVNHSFRLYSLQKIYPSRGDSYPVDVSKCIRTKKLDGCAISLLYVNGELVQGLTRGDGIKGKDITKNIVRTSIPKNINVRGIFQVTGELCVGNADTPNIRNYASGAINRNDPDEFSQRVVEGDIHFIAYDSQSKLNGCATTYGGDMKFLSSLGFETILDNVDKFPTDGWVYRLNNNKEFFKLGWTNKHPRGAFAEKEDDEYVTSILRKVTWQVGASGKVTPVGHFDPIEIDDAIISKATLNNVDYIIAWNLELGCNLHIIRAGGVRPKVIGRD